MDPGVVGQLRMKSGGEHIVFPQENGLTFDRGEHLNPDTQRSQPRGADKHTSQTRQTFLGIIVDQSRK